MAHENIVARIVQLASATQQGARVRYLASDCGQVIVASGVLHDATVEDTLAAIAWLLGCMINSAFDDPTRRRRVCALAHRIVCEGAAQ